MVDAAAQLPPVSNLWTFTQMGAALAVFSGGKDLRGPQSQRPGTRSARSDRSLPRFTAVPNANVGRPMKVGKEEMLGLLAAVERYLTLDHEAREQVLREHSRDVVDALNAIPGISGLPQLSQRSRTALTTLPADD